MIEPLSNQPLAFDASRLRGCCTLDPEDCLMVDPSDVLTFQVKATRCNDDVQVIGDPGFDSGEDWDPDGWIIGDGKACYTKGLIGSSLDGGTLTETGYTAIPGTLYEVFVLIDSSTARTGVSVYFGGVLLGTIRDVGEYTFYVTALTTASLTFVSNLDPGESLCIEGALVWVRSTDFTLEFVNTADEIVETYGIILIPGALATVLMTLRAAFTASRT